MKTTPPLSALRMTMSELYVRVLREINSIFSKVYFGRLSLLKNGRTIFPNNLLNIIMKVPNIIFSVINNAIDGNTRRFLSWC